MSLNRAHAKIDRKAVMTSEGSSDSFDTKRYVALVVVG